MVNKKGAIPLTKQATGTAMDGRTRGRNAPMAMFINKPHIGAGRKYRDAVKVDLPRIFSK